MVDLAEGDCVLDACGCVGIVLDTMDAENILYLVTSFDGMKFKHTSSKHFLKPMGAKFKRAYLREIRRTHGLHEEKQEGNS